MNLYSVEIRIAATLYIKADSPEEARTVAIAHSGGDRELPCDEVGGREDGPSDGFVYDLTFDDPRLPTVSMSPMVTFEGVTAQPVFIEELSE